MEDYIYILGGVAWLAYSLYNQNQKQKKKQQAKMNAELEDGTEEEVSPSIEDTFSKFVNQKLNLESIFDVEENKEEYLDSPYSEIDVVEEKDESAYFNPKTEGVSAFKAKVDSMQGAETEIEKVEEEEKLNDLTLNQEDIAEGFDVKKAIIYSEILNAPYIESSNR
jgi:hypothetical protein